MPGRHQRTTWASPALLGHIVFRAHTCNRAPIAAYQPQHRATSRTSSCVLVWLQVREGITTARNTAARSPKHKQQQRQQPVSASSSQLQPPQATPQREEDPGHPANSSSTRSHQACTLQQDSSAGVQQSGTAIGHRPWSQLPADEAAAKMAAAAKRYKAMAAIMTPEQRQLEEK